MKVTCILQEYVRGSHVCSQKVKNNMQFKKICMWQKEKSIMGIARYTNMYIKRAQNSWKAQTYMCTNRNFIYKCVQIEDSHINVCI